MRCSRLRSGLCADHLRAILSPHYALESARAEALSADAAAHRARTKARSLRRDADSAWGQPGGSEDEWEAWSAAESVAKEFGNEAEKANDYLDETYARRTAAIRAAAAAGHSLRGVARALGMTKESVTSLLWEAADGDDPAAGIPPPIEVTVVTIGCLLAIACAVVIYVVFG